MTPTPEECRASLARPDEKLVVGYLTGGRPWSKFVDSIDHYRTFHLTIGSGRLADPWRISIRSGVNVSAARNDLVRRFLDLPSEPEWLLLVDDDMVFPPDAPERLLHFAAEDRIVGGLCFRVKSDQTLGPTIYAADEDGWVFAWPDSTPLPTNAVLEVAATGAAFLLVHREALGKIGALTPGPNAWFREYERHHPAGGAQWISEDLWFCAKAREAGVRLAVHTGVEVGHIKSVQLNRHLYDTARTGLAWG